MKSKIRDVLILVGTLVLIALGWYVCGYLR